MQDGKRVDPSAFVAISTTIAPLVDRLRRTLRDDPTAGTNETVLTPGAADIGIVSGRHAIISVKPIVPSSRVSVQEMVSRTMTSMSHSL